MLGRSAVAAILLMSIWGGQEIRAAHEPASTGIATAVSVAAPARYDLMPAELSDGSASDGAQLARMLDEAPALDPDAPLVPEAVATLSRDPALLVADTATA